MLCTLRITTKPDQAGVIFGAKLHSPTYFTGTTDETWNEGSGRLTMLAETATEVLTFRVPGTWASSLEQQKAGEAMLMVRRRHAAQTDFVACFSAASPGIERLPVKTPAGRAAEAVGLKITLKDGKAFHILVNYEPDGTEVAFGSLKTKDRFATDYKD